MVVCRKRFFPILPSYRYTRIYIYTYVYTYYECSTETLFISIYFARTWTLLIFHLDF